MKMLEKYVKSIKVASVNNFERYFKDTKKKEKRAIDFILKKCKIKCKKLDSLK